MMRLVLVGLLALAASAARAQAPPVCAGGETLTADDLAARGAWSLSETLRWAETVHAPSVDGYDAEPVWRAVGAGRVRWLVDGLPAAGAAVIEPEGAEALPVTLSEIARVTLCPGPGLAAGVWGGPRVEIETQRPARRALASIGYGNEAGDPGPGRFLDPTLPNVERWGPTYSVAAVAGAGAWLAGRSRAHFPTDTAMLARVTNASIPSRFPKRDIYAGGVHVRTRGWTARAHATWGDDLPHVPALGRELPVRRRHVQGAAGGPIRAVGGATLAGRLHAAHRELERPAWGALPLDPAWQDWTALAGLDATHARPGLALRGGAQAEATGVDGPGLDGAAWGTLRLWGEATRETPDRAQARTATLALTVVGSDVVLGGGLTQRWRVAGGDVALSLATVPRAGRDLPTLADAVALGYTGLGTSPAIAPGAALRRDETVARLSLQQALGPGLDAHAVLEAAYAGGPTERPAFGAPDSTGAVTGGVTVADARGTSASARAGVTWTRGAWTARVFARAQGALAGDDAFGEAWRRLPVWRAGGEATLRPDARLALWARVDAQGPTRWAGYPVANVPGALLVDLGLTQTLVGGRLRGTLAGRNVLAGWLGTREQSHPLGADLAPRLFVRLEGRF